jgi:hypothetical protein
MTIESRPAKPTAITQTCVSAVHHARVVDLAFGHGLRTADGWRRRLFAGP